MVMGTHARRVALSRFAQWNTGLVRTVATLALTLLMPFALPAAHAGVGDNVLTSARYKSTCGLANFEKSLINCVGPVAPWSQMKWGASTTTFSIVKDYYTGAAASLNVTNYVDGAAFWRPSHVSVKPSTMYRYSAMVRTDSKTTAWAEVEFQLANGNYRYLPLSAVGANTSWAKFTDDFFTPSDAVAATVYVFMKSNGTVVIDNVALIELAPPSAPSSDAYLNYSLGRPLVSITFDDGTGDIWNNAIPLVDAKGYKTTQFVVGGFIGTDGFMNVNHLVSLNNAGHELGSHSWTHRSLPTLTSTDLKLETSITQSKLRTMLPSCFVDNRLSFERCFDQFAYPYGDTNQTVVNQMRNGYRTARGTQDGLNTRNINNSQILPAQSMMAKYRLHAQMVLNPTAGGGGIDELNGWLSNAQASNTWLILVYHRVNDQPDAYGLTPAEFSAHLDAIAATGVCVTPVHEALNEVQYQGVYRAKCGGDGDGDGDGDRYSSALATAVPMLERERATEPTATQIKRLNERNGLNQKTDTDVARKEYKQSRFRD